MRTILQHITYLPLLLMAFVLASCNDDYFDGFGTGTTDGISEVTLEMSFNDFIEVDPAYSRAAAGNSIEGIDDVCLLAYDAAGNIVAKRYVTRNNGLNVLGTTTDASGSTVTRRASMTFDMHYGTYRFYAVANMGDLSNYASAISTEEGFSRLRFDWNAADIAANSQMCGAVTPTSETPVVNRKAPNITINSTQLSLHSWLKRAVSKVTIAYDASNLNDNIYIYITSAQVRDIPLTCTMMAENRPELAVAAENPPASALLTDGERINYLATDGDYASSRVALARGRAYGGLTSVDTPVDGDNVHTSAEESLFFFENMQGKKPNKHVYQNFDNKDGMPYGTYIEVKGYYINRSASNPSRGPITYRYMLGMNDTDDFNAQRNTHYKVTLCFNRDANNPDWHIDYDQPEGLNVHIPEKVYISYLYNKCREVPITVRLDRDDYYVKSIRAQIVRNDYLIDSHPYAHVTSGSFGGSTYDWSNNRYGFLSLESREETMELDVTDPANYVGDRTYDSSYLEAHGSYDRATGNWIFPLPVYTRPLRLMVPDGGRLRHVGFSGNNHYTHAERHARVRVTVEIGSTVSTEFSQTFDSEVDVVQEPRILNPTGAWREHSSTRHFTFTLTVATKDAAIVSSWDAPDVPYEPIRSDGRWTARIYTENYNGAMSHPGEDWICLRRDENDTWKSGRGAEVSGSTGSKVEFQFKPAGTIGIDETRFGVIEVLYHDLQSVHMIFVSQGSGTVNIGGNNWMMGNLYANGADVPSPVADGSMYKYGNSRMALRSRNNYSLDWKVRPGRPFVDTDTVRLFFEQRAFNASTGKYYKIDPASQRHALTIRYSEAPVDFSGFHDPGLKYRIKDIEKWDVNKDGDGHEYRVAEYADYKALLDRERFGMYYGVLYGDSIRNTALYEVDRYTSTPYDGGNYKGYEQSGQRGCFIYDRATGNHLFLPIGVTGIGRRKLFYTPPGQPTRYNVLKYSDPDGPLMGAAAAGTPVLYDSFERPGACYWLKEPAMHEGRKVYAFDIDFFSYDVSFSEKQMLYDFANPASEYYSPISPPRNSWDTDYSVWSKSSDAAYLRRIRVR